MPGFLVCSRPPGDYPGTVLFIRRPSPNSVADAALGDEPGPLVKRKGVWVPYDRDTARTDSHREGHSVIDQCGGHSAAHPIGVCEEVD